MRRGTTPTHTFTTDLDLTAAEVLFVTYKQQGKTIVEKDIGEVMLEPEQISLELSQDDTLAFSTTGEVQIQIRARFAGGEAVASNIIRVPAEAILKDGVI